MTTDGAKVRPAVEGDIPAIADIYAPYVTGGVATFEEEVPDHGEWRDRMTGIAEHGLPFLVAELDGGVVGYAYADRWKARAAYRHTVEDSVYVAPGFGGRGVGRVLLSALLDECRRIGVHQVIAVIADTGRTESRGLHRALGFADIGTLPQVGRKHGRWIDIFLMQRTLDGTG